MEELRGKKALVTGGSRGIGRAIAIALAQEGVHVAITGRNEDTLKQTTKEIENFDVFSSYAVFDVSNRNEVDKELFQLQEDFGEFDILINNAGVALFGSVLDMNPDEWEDIIKTNLLGTYYVIRNIVPSMKERQLGDVVNISSTAGLKGAANTSAYSASKAGVNMLSDSLMQELRKSNVRVTNLTPSTIATDLSKSVLKITDGNPQKVLQPEDFAQLVVDILKLNKRALLTTASIFSTNP